MTLSQRTLAELTRAAEQAYTHDDLDLLFMRLEISGDGRLARTPTRSKVRRLGRAIELLSDDDRELALVRDLIEDHYQGRVVDRGSASMHLLRLVEALQLDGFELIDERIVATTPAPAALAPEISLLEEELDARGFTAAAVHYRQAVDSFVDRREEASNGQLRSALEGVLLELCHEATGRRPSDPRGAADRLRNAEFLDGDEAALFKGLVGVSNDNGAHAGLTSNDEALFRLHFTTAAIRYLLARIPAQ